jgi:DNA-binding beta-propeller fold protein YncE
MIMKKPLRFLMSAVFTGLVCVLPAIPALADTIYVATYFDGSIWQFSTDGTRSLFAGPTIFGPAALAYDKAGNLYVANANNNTIEKFTTNGVASVFAADPGDNSVMNGPEGLAFDANGNLYTVNYFGNSVTKFTTNGTPSTFATDDGSYTVLVSPDGLAFDPAGNLYVANSGGNFISEFAADGTFLGDFGDSSYLNSPYGLAFDTNGNLYVANDASSSIVKFDPSGNGSIFATDLLDTPTSLAFDKAGNLYVSNYGQSANNVVKITPGGVSSVFAVAGISFPDGLTFDSNGYLMVGNDWGSYLQKFDTNGSLVATIYPTVYNVNGLAVDSAGNVYAANSFVGGTIEKFDTNGVGTIFASHLYPSYGIAADAADNIYVAYDNENLIYKYAPNGSGGVFTTNGLNVPLSIAFDNLGNLFVVNSGTNPIVKIDAAGQSSVFATATDITKTFGPGLAVDPANNVYVLGDSVGNTIVRYTPAGTPSNFGDDPGPTGNPKGMAFDSATNLYVANFLTGTIYKFDRFGNGTVFASGLNEPVAIAIRRTGSVAVAPKLFLTRSGTNVILSWPLAAPNYTLQSCTNLAGTNWIAVPSTPGTNNGNYAITNGILGSARFFRLKGN